MVKAVVQNLVLLAGLVIAATVSGLMASAFTSPRGALGPGMLQAISLVTAGAATLGAVIVSTIIAVVVGRVTNTAVGLFVLGGGLFGLAWPLETVHEFVFTAGWAGTGAALAVETFIWAALVLAATAVVFRLSGPLRDVEPDEEGRTPHPWVSKEAAMLVVTGLLVLPVVWLVAQSSSKGQVIGAVFCGAMVVGLVGRLLAPHAQPLVLFFAPVLFGAIGHIVGGVMLKTPIDDAWVSGTVPVFTLVMPVDYAAGSLMGVAVGLGWARSFLHHEEPEHATSPG